VSKKKTKTSSSSSGTATTTPQLPSYLQAPVQNLFGEVAGMTSQSPTTFGPTANQRSAFTAAGSLGGSNPAIGQGMDATRANMNYTPDTVSAGQLSSTDLAPYMNPYIQSVVDTSLGTLGRARDMAISAGQAAATRAGAYGGSRHGVMDAETNRGFLDSAGSLAANLYGQGFQTAQQAALQDINNRIGVDTGNADRALAGAGYRLGAARQLTDQGMSADQNARSNIGTMLATGEAERQIGSENDPMQARIRQLMQLAQILGINGSDLIGQNVTQSGTQSGTSSQSGGLSFGWSPSNGFSIGYG